MNNNKTYNNEYSINIYNKVFNNIYIRKIIFNHLNKFNIFLINYIFESIKEWENFKYKEYLYNVTLDFSFDYNRLPENIKHISIRPPIDHDDEIKIISVPNHIESVKYLSLIQSKYFGTPTPHSSKLKSLKIFWMEEDLDLTPNVIPNSITDLQIITTRLLNNVLPAGLKKLTLQNLKLLEDGCLPVESLEEINILTTTPTIINQISISNCIYLVRLTYENVNAVIDSNIQFPDTLQELTIDCNTFNAKLPANLKSLDLKVNRYQKPVLFPPSLEYLQVKYTYPSYNQEIVQNGQTLPPNLKLLQFPCSSITDKNGKSILPNTLEKLVIKGKFNQELQFGHLPSSLTHLDLGLSYFNKVIDINVLPANLETLVLGPYTQVINPLAIPKQLKLLKINKNHYFPLINLTSTSHPYTVITTMPINSYYQASSAKFDQIRVLRLPNLFNSPLSTLQLQNKSNLEYLHLGEEFNQEIQLSDLPTQNNIKTLVLSNDFSKAINLEHFQNLETIIVPLLNSSTTITTTITTTILNDQLKEVHYNNYKLKNIVVSPTQIYFLKRLDINFYQFLKSSSNYNISNRLI